MYASTTVAAYGYIKVPGFAGASPSKLGKAVVRSMEYHWSELAINSLHSSELLTCHFRVDGIRYRLNKVCHCDLSAIEIELLIHGPPLRYRAISLSRTWVSKFLPFE